jgi:hypothetical protein
MTEQFGTEEEAVGGAFTLAMTKRPAEKSRIIRAENVMVARAEHLHALLTDDDSELGDRLTANAAFYRAAQEHTHAVLAFFELQPNPFQ